MSTDSDHKPQAMRKANRLRGGDDCGKPPDKPMTVAQRRGLARKIAASLRRSGLDCELVEEDRDPPRRLN
jgi:hypothetical protein